MPTPQRTPEGGRWGWTCESSTKPTEKFKGAFGIPNDVGGSWAAFASTCCTPQFWEARAARHSEGYWLLFGVGIGVVLGGIGWNWSPSDVLGLHANRFSGPVAHAPSLNGRHIAAR